MTVEPTVKICIDDSEFAFNEKGEVLERNAGEPWTDAGICDHRGPGGPAGHLVLCRALECAEGVARTQGTSISRVPD